jgi:predicted permease
MAGYDPARAAPLYLRLLDRLAAIPGVEAATVARYSPFSGGFSRNPAVVEGHPIVENETIETVLVGPRYPETMGMIVRLGRALTAADVAAARPVGVVNDAFVRRYFPGENPLGRRFGIRGGGVPDLEIVGVVSDAQFHDVRAAAEPMAFVPMSPSYGEFALDAELAIRAAPGALVAADTIRRAVLDVDPDLPIDAPRPLSDQLQRSFGAAHMSSALVGAFSVLALALACVGLYGLEAQAAAGRTQEIGIRLALGARRSQVLGMMLRDAIRPLAVGAALGLAAALVAARLLQSQLFGVGAFDPWSLGGSVLALVLVALIAAFIPARRATKVDPLITLRAE